MKSAEASVFKKVNFYMLPAQLCVFVIKYYSAVCVDFYLLNEYISVGLFFAVVKKKLFILCDC